MTAIEYLENLERDLKFQIHVSETVNTSNIRISRDQGYLVLTMIQILKESGIKGGSNDENRG